MRFALVPPAAQALAIQGADRDLVLSADGTHLVYVAGPEAQLMVRAIDAARGSPFDFARDAVPTDRAALEDAVYRRQRRDLA